MSRRGAPVVISRKSKRLGFGHLLAFAATGGTSAVYSATKAATNAGYNARTRKLAAESSADPLPRGRRTRNPRRSGVGQWHPVRLDGSPSAVVTADADAALDQARADWSAGRISDEELAQAEETHDSLRRNL